MLSSEKFMTDFISECVQNGDNSPPQICKCAEEEIKRLDEKIKEIEGLRTKQGHLRAVIKKLNGEVEDRRKKYISAPIDSSVEESGLDPYIRQLCVDICTFVDSQDTEVTVRDIIDAVASIEANSSVYISVKWLVDRGILMRGNNAVDRAIVKGEKWDERPA